MKFFVILELVVGRTRPFRIAENVETVEGTRTRFTSFCFASLAEAADQIETLLSSKETET